MDCFSLLTSINSEPSNIFLVSFKVPRLACSALCIMNGDASVKVPFILVILKNLSYTLCKGEFGTESIRGLLLPVISGKLKLFISRAILIPRVT